MSAIDGNKRQKRAHDPEEEPAGQRQMQARDRQHMRQTGIAEGGAVALVDAAALAGDERGGNGAARAGNDVA